MVFAALKQIGKRVAIHANYRLSRYQDVIWLVGDGRSGTTWVSNVVNWHGRHREMFEPFHPALIEELKAAKLHQYLRPNDVTNELSSALFAIFSGQFYHPRPDALNRRLSYQGLLVKDIFANLLIGWVNQNIPHVKKVLIIRNPFAVALSKQKRVRGIWMKEPNDFLTQPELVEDYLAPFQTQIRGISSDFIERQLLIWAIIHYVPLQQIKSKQIKQNDIYILFYEDFFREPERESKKLFSYLFGSAPGEMNDQLLAKIANPSHSPGKDSNIIIGKSPVDAWRGELSSVQIDRGLQLLEEFGLGDLYGTAATPNKAALHNYLGFSTDSL